MTRAIDSEAAYRFLSEQLVKETGAFSKGVNKGLNIARSAMRNPDAIPTLTQPNEWVNVEDRMPEPGSLIVYADVCIDEVAYGVLRVPQGKCHKVYNYWMCLSDRFNRRPPEGEEKA